jgi:hypothetical protein
MEGLDGRTPFLATQLFHDSLATIFFPNSVSSWGLQPGARWCRCRVKFNEVREKVPKVPEKFLGSFGAEPEKVPENVWEALVQSQVRFRRRCRRRCGRLWCRTKSQSTRLRRKIQRRFHKRSRDVT